MRTPDGRLRVPTDAELDLMDTVCVAITRALDDPEHEDDPFYAAHMTVSAVVDAGWTPPPPGYIPPARPDTRGQGDLLAAPTTGDAS